MARSGELRHNGAITAPELCQNRVRRCHNGANGFHGAESGRGLHGRSLSALREQAHDKPPVVCLKKRA